MGDDVVEQTGDALKVGVVAGAGIGVPAGPSVSIGLIAAKASRAFFA